MNSIPSSHTPLGLSLEAFSQKTDVLDPVEHAHIHHHAPAGSGLLNVQCTCGGACCSGSASAEEHEPDQKHGHRHAHEHSHGGGTSWKKLAAAGISAAFSEGVHFAVEAGAFQGSALSAWSLAGFSLFEALPLLFALAAIVLSGVETYKEGWRAIRNFDLNMMALMSVAVTGAVLIGQFPEAAMVMVLFNISEAIEGRVLEKARRAIQELLALSPETARVCQADQSWKEMDCRKVSLGALVRVNPGERVPLDGVVRAGHSAIDQSPITGESIPVEKAPGDTVFAGTINTSGSFDFTVTAVASDTTLARIIHAVEKAQAVRAPIQRFVDVFARWYTPAIFAVSVLLALIPPLFLGAAWMSSVYTALVVLVIGCPCALVISTPVTIVSGMAAATRHGILVKGGVFLEQGRRLRVLALDKTGTLTHGRPRLTDARFLDDRVEARVAAFSLSARSDHPVSCAVAEALKLEENTELREVESFLAVAGQGVSGILGGTRWYLGSLRMMKEQGVLREAEDSLMHQARELEAQGKTVVALSDSSRVCALFAVADTIRESSVLAVRELRELGVRTVMLTGDNESAARSIAAQAGVDGFRARLLPEDKQAAVASLVLEEQQNIANHSQRQEARRGKVGMVGDGINDAPALARADIGFAMAGSGTDTAMETADVALMDDDLRKIPRFIRLSRAVYGILLQNIALALGVKMLFFALTLAGYTTMWMAVFADVGTALMVVANGLRAGRY